MTERGSVNGFANRNSISHDFGEIFGQRLAILSVHRSSLRSISAE